MIYFDYDGVIGNTEDRLFDEYERQKEYLEGLTRRQYLINLDWYDWLKKKGPRGTSFEVLKKHDPKDASILISVLNEKERQRIKTVLNDRGYSRVCFVDENVDIIQ